MLTDYNLIVLSIYRSDAGEFDTFLDLLDSCLNFTLGLVSNVRIVLGGDFNTLLNSETLQTKKLTQLLRSYGLYWTCTEPTRGPNCLDSSASNCNVWEISTEVLNPLVADHLAVVSEISIEPVSKSTTIIPWLKDYSINLRKIYLSVLPLFKSALAQVNWDLINFSRDSNSVFDSFFDKFTDTFNFYFPVKSVRPRSHHTIKSTVQNNNNNWYTEELKQHRSWVLLLHERYKKAQSIAEKDRFYRLYLDIKRQYRRKVDLAKKEGNSRLIENSMNPCKAAWNLINSHRKKDPVSTCPASPDDINNYFIQTVERLVGVMPDRSEDALFNVKEPTGLEWTVWREVSAQDILKIVASFKCSSSMDVYGMSTVFLKEIVGTIADVLAMVFNICLKEGVFPDKLKLARTVPVFKKGDSSDISSYRPISIVPVLAKVLETIMNKQLMSYFERNNLLTCMQHGFRRGKSTVTAVETLAKKVYDAFEDHKSVVLTLCDLTKAFDCASHKILLLKLKKYGIRGPVLNTLQSYLSDRNQLVTIRGASSQVLKVEHGVPQGSVLGPLLFLILVNDLSTTESNALLYADDTTLFTSGSDINCLLEDASNSLKNAKTWFELNNLMLNEGKTQQLFCSLWRRPIENLKRDVPENQVKLLGIFIDTKLNWNYHVEQVCVKLSRVTYLLRKLKALVTPEYLLKVYYGLFHCHINYGIILWGQASGCDRVLIMQKTAVRVITSSERLAHCRPLFQELGVLTVHCQYILSCILHLKATAPLTELTRDTIHSHNTRGRNNLNVPQCRLSKTKDSYPMVAYRMFNKLPTDIRCLKPEHLRVRLSSWLVRKSFYTLQEFFEDPISDM